MVEAAAGAALEVIDAQYGGILPDSASVLVACRQWLAAADGQVSEAGTTIDVRLARASPRWMVTELRPADPGSVATRLSAAASAVLGSSRIVLAPAAVADVLSGQVHDSVLAAMLACP